MKTKRPHPFRVFTASVLLPLSLLSATSLAGTVDNSWVSFPEGNSWNTNFNWSNFTVPNSTTATAHFFTSNVTNISLNSSISVGQMIFSGNNGQPIDSRPTQKPLNSVVTKGPLPLNGSFTITTNGNDLDFYGQGIVNNSGLTQTIINGGRVAVQTGVRSESIGGGTITFHNSSSAGSNVLIINQGETATVDFFDNSSAGSATIVNQGRFSNVTFFDNSSGGQAAIVNVDPTSYVDISNLNGGTTLGSIAGGGTVYLGGNNLAVGGNNQSTVFYGVITDGSASEDGELPAGLHGFKPVFGGTGGTLTKVGGGTLTLAGANTYTGNTFVDGGTLDVTGSIISPNTYVNPGGTLLVDGKIAGNAILNGGMIGGNGIIGGSLLNYGGMISPGHSPGTLHINGNYYQGPAAALQIQIASTSNYDHVMVGGSATLGGTLFVDPLNGFKAKRGQTFEFFVADGGISGRFASVIQPDTNSILRYDVIYRGNEILLEAAVASFADTLQGLTPNQTAVANELDRVVNDRRAAKIIDYLSQRPLDELPGDFDRIAGEELTSIFTLGTSFDNVQTLNLQRRNEDLRAGASGFSAAGFHAAGSGPAFSGGFGLAGPNGSDGKESKEMKTVAPEEPRWGAFITGVGEWVGVSDDYNARGYDIQTGGFTLGVDYKVCPNFAIGLMAGYVGTGIDLTDGGRVWVNGGKLGIYGTSFVGGFYTDFAVTGGYSSYDTRRSALQGDARGSTDGGDLNVLFGAGYEFKTGGFTFGPTATFNYTYVGISQFNESGSLAPLDIKSQGQDSLRTAFGFKASYDLKCGGLIIKPEISASWQHEYGDASYALDSSFASGAGNIFTVNGPKIGRDSLLVGAGVAIQLSERTSTYVYYDGDLGRNRYDSHNVSGGFRISF